MRSLLFLYCCFISCTSARAILLSDSLKMEGNKGKLNILKQRIDNMLDSRDSNTVSRIDTNYMQRLPQRLRFKIIVNAYGSNLKAEGLVGEDIPFKSELSANNKYTVSINASYRGLSLGLSVNPGHLNGTDKNYEFNVNLYGNKFGADLIYQSSKTYSGLAELSNEKKDKDPLWTYQSGYVDAQPLLCF